MEQTSLLVMTWFGGLACWAAVAVSSDDAAQLRDEIVSFQRTIGDAEVTCGVDDLDDVIDT
jgi:hypothetical protein